MKKILFAFIFTALTACATNKPAVESPASTDSAQSFAFSLFSAVNSSTKNVENFCISPASAQWALAMTANGAKGTTAQEIYSTLGYAYGAVERTAFNTLQQNNIETINNSRKAKVSVANSIWVNKKIKLKNSFIGKNTDFYNATVKNVTFDPATVKEINGWCSEKTEGKIKSILDEANPTTKLLLINALYFKAKWAHPFYKDATKDDTFTKADGEKVTVPMMRQSRVTNYYEDSIMQATERVFEEGEYSMLLILPRKWVSMQEAIDHIAKSYKNGLFNNSKSYFVHLSMPRFRTEFGTSLKPMLNAMGINDAFTPEADFSGISDASLLIDDVIQKSYISVDEEGAEAAAVTAVQMRVAGLPREENKILTLDRPFIYAIKSKKTGEILFIGKVGNPQE